MRKKLALSIALSLAATLPVNAQVLVQETGLDNTNHASATNPVPVQQSVGGAALSASNPVPVFLSDSSKATYSATIDSFTPVATPTDVIGIVGSATKTVKIHKIFMSNTQTTAGLNKWYLVKRSTADTGSTPVAATLVPLDSSAAAATAVVQKYTAANPTTGTLVGNVRIIQVLAPAPASTTGGADNIIFDDSATGEPLTLRGATQEADLNFGGAAVPTGLSIAVTVVFTEE